MPGVVRTVRTHLRRLLHGGRGRRHGGRALTALVTAVATLVSYVLVSMPVRPAQAADAETTAAIGLYDELEGFVAGLGAVGALAEPLKTLSVSPGGPNGLDLATLLGDARSTVLGGAGFGGASTLDDLRDAIDGAEGSLGSGRQIAFTASRATNGDVESLTVGVTATDTVQSSLDIGDDSPPFSFASAGGVEVDLSLSASFVLNVDTTDMSTWLSADPTLSVSGSASIPDFTAVLAGVGILGVRLATDSTFDLDATVGTTWTDPNNDGRLTFDEPGGVADDGELSAAGAGAGLVAAVLTDGAVSGSLHIQARPSPAIALGDANATVSLTDGDAGPGISPQVSFGGGGFDAIAPFLTLSTRDLAQGLAQAASAVLNTQQNAGVALPFMRGDLADAIGSVDAIVAFLDKYVPEPTPGSETPGLPGFPSLQDLLEKLKAETNLPGSADIDVLGATYDAAAKKVVWTLKVSRTAPGSGEALNPTGTATTGSGATVSYTGTTLTDTSKNFDADGLAASLVGRQVVAGASGGIVKSVSGDTLTLDPAPLDPDGDGPDPAPAVAWQGGTPTDGTAYSITAGDPKTGLVELGNALKDSGGIANANAKVAQATVKPSFALTVPIVLDLRAPDTTDCDPDPGATAACPFSQTANGITRIISSLPLAADRIMLRTGASGTTDLLTADAPVHTTVDVDATVGFVGVKVTGTLDECTSNAAADCSGATNSGDHLLTIGLKSLAGSGGDAQGDISIPAFVEALRAAVEGDSLSDVLDVDVDAQAFASLKVSVPGAPTFFDGLQDATVTVAMPDITDPTDVDVTAPDLSQLLAIDVDPENPLALFGALLTALQSVQGTIGSVPGGSGVGTKIPMLGRSFSDIIGSGVSGGGTDVEYEAGSEPNTSRLTDPDKTFTDAFIGRRLVVGSVTTYVVDTTATTLTLKPALSPLPANGTPYALDSELQGVINLLQQDPSATLQEMLDLVETQLGGGSAADFAIEPPASPGDDTTLRVDLDWKRSYTTKAPLNFSFDVGALGDQSMVGAKGTGQLDVSATGEVKLTLRLPLTQAALADPAGSLTIDPAGSFVKAGVSVEGDGVRLQANLGPFKASLGNPSDPAGTQLHAGLGVTLANTGTDPVSLSDFFGPGLSLDVDGNGVSCPGAPVSEGTTLALCAVFPAYLNGNPVNADPALNNFVVRLPVGDDLADSFDLAGADVGGQPRLVLPTGLDTALENAALNLLTFGDGLFGYLEFLENALRTASFDGKIPVIGKDLQAGSDFLGKIRTDLQTAFEESGVPQNATAGDIRDFLDTKLDQALPNDGALQIDLSCTTTLAPAPKPGVTKHGSDTTATYAYKVVAYTNPGKDQTFASPASDTVSNVAAANLDDTNYNSVSWAAVPNATGYLVLRSVDGGTYTNIGEVSGTSFDDKVTGAGAAYTEVSEAPKVIPCPDSASALEVDGFTLTVDLGQGDPSGTEGCTGPDCLSAEVPLDLGIPGLSLKATDASEGVTASLGWSLHLQVGLNRDDGFFVATDDEPAPEFQVGANLQIPDTQAQLAFITIDAEGNKPDPEFAGRFSIDITDPSGSDGKLTLDDVTSSSIANMLDVKLTAGVDIDWHLTATAGSALPGIMADFVMAWNWTSQAPGDFDDLSIAFNNVELSAGEFLGSVIKPIIQQVVDVYKPIQPVIDTIFAPIPVLSDLSKAVGGDEITIASLAETFSTLAGGPDIGPFLDVLQNIRDLVKNLSANGTLKVGSFQLVTSKAVSTDANPGTAASLIDTADPSYDLNDNLLQDVDDATPGDLQGTGGDEQSLAADSAAHPGFTFPFLENPSTIFGLIVGQDVELVRFDSGPLTLGFQFQQSFGPVYAPPPVNIVVGGGASVTLRVMAGFDTYGIRTAIENGKLDAKILDSLYFITADESGKPVPVVEFEGFLQAGASVSAVIIEVGVVGGIKLTIGFFWNDPNNDGKFRFGEFLATALSNPICLFNVGGELSLFIKVFITLGFSPFSVSFDFTLVNIKLLDFSLKPDCTPPPPRLGGAKDGVLYLFAGKFGGSGPRGHSAWDAENKDDETWVVRQMPPKDGAPAKLVVQALGISEEFESTDITTVVLDGRGYTGKLQVMLNGGTKEQPFDKKAVIITGSGEDTIRTGVGASWVDSGGAHDEVTTLDRPNLAADPTSAPKARVAGGAGPDAVTVGNAADTVMGDGKLDVEQFAASITVEAANGDDVSLAGMIDPDKVTVPADPSAPDVNGAGSDGSDQVSAGLGGSHLYGNNGDDKIGTANDNPQADLAGIKGTADEAKYRARANVVVGGGGSDKLKSGSADDVIYTGAEDDSAKNDTGPNNTGSGDASGDENAVDTGTGNDTVYGSNGKDFVTTHSTASQTATAYGGGQDDVLIGALGTDELYGGPGDDYLVAGPASVSADKPVTDDLGSARRVTLEELTPPASEKVLVGGGGSDRIYGVDGPATIYGDHEVDRCERQSDPVSAQPPEHPTTGGPAADNDAADLVLGGDGVDTVQAGGGDDHVYLAGADDVACGNAGDDRVFGGSGDDLEYGGSNKDTMYGDAGLDELYGNTGDDTAYGGSQADRIQGNQGSDVLFGGTAADTIVGGTSKAGTADEGDLLYGDQGDDVLIGDNGKPDPTPTYPDDLANTDAAPTIGGEDDVFGGDGDDRAFGGLEGDRVHGGAGADHEEGNNGADMVWGDGGADNIAGGSSESAAAGQGRPDTGDQLWGGADDDVITGDNASVENAGGGLGSVLTRGRGMTSERSITLLDLGDAPLASTFGKDVVHGDGGTDVILAQGDPDRVFGDAASDYAEGGPAKDWVEGGPGSDDLVGGSSTILSGSGDGATGQPDTADVVWGQGGDDVVAGDNAVITRVAPFNDLTFRIGGDGTLEERRAIRLLDLSNGGLLVPPDAIRFGGDQLSGQAGVDVLLGQDGADAVSGGSADDYAEGQGAGDVIFGDDPLADHGILPVPPAGGWPGSASTGYDGDGLAAGQDDLIGGSSRPGFRDAGDEVHGNGASDYVLGDNGTAVRDVQSDGVTVSPDDPAPTGVLTDRAYARRYASPTPAGAAKVRHHDPDQSEPTTRFCTTAQATCEVAAASGADTLFGEGGDDFLYGQDGGDQIRGGSEDDDVYGELGADLLWGDAGDDAILGDRGGVRDDYQDGSATFDQAVTQVPKVEFRGFPQGSVTRTTDLLHDVDGDAFVGSSGSAAMPHPGLTEGGDDRIRGGTGHDSIHAGWGDDLANGDSGGDWVFGDDGADVLWGGKGCDQQVDTPASAPYCYPGGVFDPAPHDAAGETLPQVTDYVLGGKGGTSAASVQGASGSDVLDWRPRGTYVAGTGCTTQPWPVDLQAGGKKGSSTTIDPCSWFEMTNLDTADDADNQHHQGVDWQYGGWDRDVLQGDVADNGPNEGDRLLDWNGAYNLYTHCNSAYGGYNDVRQHSPSWQQFLQRWAYALGAGQEQADASTSGRSAYVELALVYPGADNSHGSGSAYPGTPGHFDNPNACAP